MIRNRIRTSTLGVVASALMLTAFSSMTHVVYADQTHCTGYSDCVSKGFTDHGYESVSGTSYWRADPGHNCTNYVAWVLKSKMTDEPANNLGNATTWATNAAALGIPVDDAPSIGSVAQWDATSKPIYGHVAYVEKVNTDGSIVVSEDAAPSGPFKWRTISPGSSDWPDKFIHFNSGAMAIINSSNEVWAKTKVRYGEWQGQAAGIAKVRVNGTKTAIINTAGQVYAKEGTGSWVDQQATASDVQLTTTGILVITTPSGQVYAKSGIAPGGWIDQGATASAIRANGTRLAIINGAGEVWAKDGISNAVWYNQNATVQDVQVSSNGRMAIINGAGQVYAKDSLGYGGWVNQNANATKIRANGDRIALINSAGEVWAKDKLPASEWKNQGATAVDVQLSPNGRMVLMNSGGQIWAKDGLAHGPWFDQNAVATQLSVGAEK